MGFYIRKSLKVGPIRFNISKSGVGVSTGFKGFRIGTGPRGNYIHAGCKGIYYRASFPLSNQNKKSNRRSKEEVDSSQNHLDTNNTELQEIESGDVLAMHDSTATLLLEELNSKKKKLRLFPVVFCLAMLLGFIILVSSISILIKLIIIPIIIYSIYYAFNYDLLNKTVVLFYEFDDELEKAYQLLHDSFDQLSKSVKIWHITAQGKSNDWKRNAGATSIVNRNQIKLKKMSPPFIKTNISVPAIPAGKQTLYFFPERILVYDNKGIGAVNYRDLNLEIENTKFIESDIVPRDAQIVDKTWQYVNKKGGPDKRFKDNKQLPIALYEEFHFKSNSGLNELLQFSKCNVCNSFKDSIIRLSKYIKN